MAKIKFSLSGSKAGDVKKIIIFSQDKSKELVTVSVESGKLTSLEAHKIDETEIYIVVVYKGILNKLEHNHYYDIKIIGDGKIIIAADGEGKSLVSFRG